MEWDRRGTRGGDRETRGEERRKKKERMKVRHHDLFFILQREHTRTHTNMHVYMRANVRTSEFEMEM